jgi:hypothetical protein
VLGIVDVGGQKQIDIEGVEQMIAQSITSW